MSFYLETDETLLRDELSRLCHMDEQETDPLRISIDGCIEEFMRYVSCYDRGIPDIERKVVHSLRVATLCHRLFGDGNVDDASFSRNAMTLAGLLHDVGRFPQWAMHAAYRDHEHGCDHGLLAYELLTRFGMLGRFVPDVEPKSDASRHLGMICEAIRVHNQWVLPSDFAGDQLTYATMLRDADIIDILDITATKPGMPNDPKDASEAATEAVMAFVRNGQTVDRKLMRNGTDVIISRLALTFAVRGDAARRILTEHRSWDRYLEGKTLSGDATANVEEAVLLIKRKLDIG